MKKIFLTFALFVLAIGFPAFVYGETISKGVLQYENKTYGFRLRPYPENKIVIVSGTQKGSFIIKTKGNTDVGDGLVNIMYLNALSKKKYMRKGDLLFERGVSDQRGFDYAGENNAYYFGTESIQDSSGFPEWLMTEKNSKAVLGFATFSVAKKNSQYVNTKYHFSFSYPKGVEAGDAMDNTGGQIPNVAYFQTNKYPWKGDPFKKGFTARVLVYTNSPETPLEAVQSEYRNVPDLIVKKKNVVVGGNKGIAVTLKIKSIGDFGEPPYPFMTYFVKDGSTLYQISGMSNSYPAPKQFVKDFEKIVSSIAFGVE